MEPIRRDRWPLGINNVTRASRLPEGAVRNLVNFDPSADGLLALRAGYSKVLDCDSASAVYVVGDHLVVVDGQDIRTYHEPSGSVATLGQVADGASVSATEWAGTLYLNTQVDSFRTDGKSMKPWAIAAPGFRVEVDSGGTLSGQYQVAVVATGADGEESGTDPVLVSVPDGSMLRVFSDDPRPLRTYASVANGKTLFYQGLLIGGAVAMSSMRDDTEYLDTAGLAPLPYCEELVAYHGVLVGRSGNHVFFTVPMRPHLMDPVAGFFQFPAPVRLLVATDGGVYIVADRTYFVTDLESGEPKQQVVLDLDAVAGTAAYLPDGRVAWFTRYGQAVATPTGQVELVNRQNFAPDIAEAGAAGVVAHNGNEMVVTTMRGVTGTNNLATGDFADLEIG